ncbi:MAG: hypothetical protein ACK56I_37250, partial [bacterium]
MHHGQGLGLQGGGPRRARRHLPWIGEAGRGQPRTQPTRAAAATKHGSLQGTNRHTHTPPVRTCP